MIVKNEQDTLERCLESVTGIVDEIVIVDTGSSDDTKEIAKKYTKNVIDFKWIDDFSAARNFSFSNATKDYILWLDADDVLLPEDSKKLLRLKQSMDPTWDGVSMEYHCDFDAHGNVTLSVRRIRLVKRSKNFKWYGAVHEDLTVTGSNIYDSDIVVTHRKIHSNSDRNLKIYESRLLQGKEFTPQDIFHYARELHQHHLYEKAVQFYLQFMNLENVETENKIFVCSKLADCYYHLGDRVKEREYVFKSFEYDVPRSEFCCRLAYQFLEKNEYTQAIFWYKLALETPLSKNSWAIINHASRTWLPHLQLSLCYYQLGEYELSLQHNKIVLAYRPNDEQVLNNIQLLEELLQQK
jgi:glycosyltransferase involved in cell wall biosynthesis